jgi:Flp pilus assembly protein TadG
MIPRLFDCPMVNATTDQSRHMGRRLVSDQRGSVAIWVGIALTVFIGCAGIAVDTARGYMLKARLSQAIDAAALAGAKSLGTGHVKEDITMFFNANFPANQFDAVVTGPIITPADPDTNPSPDNRIKVSATAKVDTTLMSVLGFKDMTVAAEATAVRGLQGLDLVISIDVSGSMCQPCTKIQLAQKAAKDLVSTVYGSETTPKVVTISGVSYNILNIGLVPWNSKVNVTYNDKFDKAAAYTGATKVTQGVTTYNHPLTGASQNFYWQANNSEVRLLSDPGPNWKGGVYARYIDNKAAQNPNDDADMKLGYVKTGGKDWVAFEPITTAEGEPNTSSTYYNNVTGGTYAQSPFTNWTVSTNQQRVKNCYSAYHNDGFEDPKNHPIAVPDTPAYWVPAYPKKLSNTSDFTHAGKDFAECRPAPTQGILPLIPVKDNGDKLKVDGAIDKLYDSNVGLNGGTNAEQGLFWAWEVLMPGIPFDEAKVSVPFNRTQAIVLLTDGESTGFNGDAYKGVFGPDTLANSTIDHGELIQNVKKCKDETSNVPPADFKVYNNLNGRLYALAKTIKGADPEKGVKIFVVQYQAPDPNLADLLKLVATKCGAPYYFRADNDTALEAAFKEIAAELAVLRLEK